MSTGTQSFEAYEAAKQAGYRVIGGDCTTVSLAGDYSSGGRHGPLSTIHERAANEVLSWEDVIADGSHLNVSPVSDYFDPFWAITGRRAETFALVLSMTAKWFPHNGFAGVSLIFNATGVSQDTC